MERAAGGHAGFRAHHGGSRRAQRNLYPLGRLRPARRAAEAAADVPPTANLPGGGLQARNSFGKTGYGGPCPPAGNPHRYFFRLHALKRPLGLKPGVSRDEVENAMRDEVLSTAELMGKFSR
jgi:Raf kinase inhibitor-like YbhB/YbcL family protein